ncbi:MAG: hypothetical protein Q9195_002522 [Heterodermia aff. obscurata]
MSASNGEASGERERGGDQQPPNTTDDTETSSTSTLDNATRMRLWLQTTQQLSERIEWLITENERLRAAAAPAAALSHDAQLQQARDLSLFNIFHVAFTALVYIEDMINKSQALLLNPPISLPCLIPSDIPSLFNPNQPSQPPLSLSATQIQQAQQPLAPQAPTTPEPESDDQETDDEETDDEEPDDEESDDQEPSETYEEAIARGRENTLTQQKIDIAGAIIRQLEASSQFYTQLGGARRLAWGLRDSLYMEASRVSDENVENLRTIENSVVVNDLQQAAIRAVWRFYHLSIFRGVEQHRRNLEDDNARIDTAIDRWSRGILDLTATIEEELRNRAEMRRNELANLLTVTAEQSNFMLGLVEIGWMPPDEWLFTDEERQILDFVQRDSN